VSALALLDGAAEVTGALDGSVLATLVAVGDSAEAAPVGAVVPSPLDAPAQENVKTDIATNARRKTFMRTGYSAVTHGSTVASARSVFDGRTRHGRSAAVRR
jgi:hypothetical protein